VSDAPATRAGIPQRASTAAARLAAVRPWPVLAVLVAAQLGLGLFFAFATPHNGWVWYSGGDATTYWTEAWSIGHFVMPPAAIGYGVPVYYSWVPLVAGPSLMQGAAVIGLLQVIVLAPLGLILFWATADRLFGRVYAWCAALLWVTWPLLMLLGFVASYHWVFDQLFLAPHWYGLTPMADLPSVVAVLAAMWLTLRAVDERSATDTVLAGLLGGVALGLKPANAFFLPAVAVLLLGARRPRQAALWVAALVPSLVTLVLWKYRGLGYLPLTSSAYAQVHVAAGASMPLAFGGGHYVPFDLHHFGEELSSLREVFWSLRLIEFLVVAGAFGVIRKAPLKGAFLVVWFAAFGIVKASTSGSDFPSATYFRLAEPGLPALLLIVLGVGFCLPALGRRLPSPGPPDVEWLRGLDLRKVVPAAVICALVPLVLIAAVQNSKTDLTARDENRVQEAPLTNQLHLRAVRGRGKAVHLTWTKPNTSGANVTYYVFWSGHDDGCDPILRGANHCKFNTMALLGETGATTFTDSLADYSQKWYRVAVAANYRGYHGDLMLLSPAVRVSA
jgi:hypothetical protein